MNGEQVAYRQIRGKDNCPLRIREAEWVSVAGARSRFVVGAIDFTATRQRASVLRIDAKD
ncbi:hypothetical protein NDK50_18525 [Paraburkholderia bryophila]|uniref:hypothetical protein n=1 Tax=Paraburkholderia bryophila TaxID=420952 RepID=UPI00234920E7|nr:hypothetical protein [Paraburkholderia bryophila]WCM19393.1 hypothetical protein NDK50_18525 [Paraburkholderia bryophila]